MNPGQTDEKSGPTNEAASAQGTSTSLPPPPPRSLPPAPDPALSEGPIRPVEVMPSNLPPPPALPSQAPPVVRNTQLDDVVSLIEQNEWSKVCAQLTPSRDALPATSPALGLLYAVALREEELRRAQGEKSLDTGTERLALESLALLLGISPDSAAARIIARRLLRRPWSAAPAPAARTSILIVTVAIAVGALVGWILDEGFDRFYHR